MNSYYFLFTILNFYGLFVFFFIINKLAYLYKRPEDKNFNLYFLAISLAPVDFPVAPPPSQEI